MTEWAAVPAIEAARVSAKHLEMRDAYGSDDDDYLEWLAGKPFSPERMGWWYELVTCAVARGVSFRRARIVSEPVTEYIRFEYEITSYNLAAGEEVRWLPRRQASELSLPGNDFWLFDSDLVIFNHFTGDGHSPDDPEEVRREPSIVEMCAASFEAVWARAIPHADYRL